MSYKANRVAADKLLNEQKAIIGKYSSRLDFNRVKTSYVFKVDEYADREENTDLFFFEFKRLRIACRMRFNISSSHYKDITIRSSLSSGNDTELDKIKEGFGDYMLYCWGTREEIREFIVLDLDVFRQNISLYQKDERINNADNRTSFATFDLYKILGTPCCVVASLNNFQSA